MNTRKFYSLAIISIILNLTPSHSLADLKSGLVFLYLFNGNANDESGNNNHGIINGPKPSINRFDKTNSSYLFNGTSDYIKIPSPFKLK